MKTPSLRDENPCRPRHFKPASCTPTPLEGPAKQSLDTSHTRLLITAALFCVAFLVISGKLVWVTAFKSGDQHLAHRDVPTEPVVRRADIVDRNGVLLATTLELPSLFADPKQIIDAPDAARKLVKILPDLDEAETAAKLGSGKSFVWLKRQLTPRQEDQVNRLGIPGLEFQDEGKRVYPKGNVTAHVVGFAGLDDKGEAGIENGLDAALRSRRDPVQLALDLRLQYILRDQIAQAITSFSAVGGMGLIMDVRTGEVLSLVSLPDFDPNDPPATAKNDDRLFNRATQGTYEMGSVFKIFTVAMALENHTTTLEGGYDATNPIHIGRFTIHDDHAQHRYLTVPEIFQYSSNIGAAKIALDVGADRQREFLDRLGLLARPALELREVGRPEYPAEWHPVNTMTIGFGHGISVSPLQTAAAVAAVVNGGILHPPTLLRRPEGQPVPGQQVLSLSTSENMRRLLRLVVERGTGKFANAPGYLVGGKTGTAEKVSGAHYERHALLSTFVGVFPINDPRYLVMVSIDEPHGNKQSFGYATAGWVAAPAVRETIERMASLVGIQPVDEDSPEIRRSLMVNLPTPQGRKIAAN